jgi:hypothetical protein
MGLQRTGPRPIGAVLGPLIVVAVFWLRAIIKRDTDLLIPAVLTLGVLATAVALPHPRITNQDRSWIPGIFEIWLHVAATA